MYSRADPFAAEIEAEAARVERASTLAGLGEGLLDVVRAAAVAKGVALPGRQSAYMAPIPADCEQVAVLMSGWNPTPAPEGPTVCMPFRWMAGCSVIITRCTPALPGKGRPLSSVEADKMTEALRVASSDAEVLLEVVNRLGEIGSDLSVVINPPSGGLQTVELNVQLLPTGSL